MGVLVFRKKDRKKTARTITPLSISDYSSQKQIRMIRNNLDLLIAKSPAIILVTSADSIDMKPAISASLAIAYAQQGNKVLLVDADISEPKIHDLFEINNVFGFTNAIYNEEHLMRNVTVTEVPWLSVMPAGSFTDYESEIWIASKIRKFAEMCKSEFDLVILNVAPLLTETDALLLANQSDGILLVVEQNNTKKEAVLKIKDYLRRSNNPILGVIFQSSSL